METDERYMKRCIELARLGIGHVAPNPLVGAVVVYNDAIIGEGFHQKYGEAHAEVNAIHSVENQSLLSESTIYVSLEPCAHFGKTPPCADLIVKHRFKRVVIGSGDSFSEVSGKGIERLKAAGIEVETFVLEKECRQLNKAFFTFHEKKRPFVFLKWAQSSNGFIDASNENPGSITWVSQPEVQPLVHKWRNEYQAILVGKNTILADNPSLTCRAYHGRNPLRIALDSHCEIPNSSHVLSDGGETIVFNTMKSEQTGAVRFVKLEDMKPSTILEALYRLNIQSVFIEGGAKTLQSFIDSTLWDEACIIQGQHPISNGTPAPKLIGQHVDSETISGDTLNYFIP